MDPWTNIDGYEEPRLSSLNQVRSATTSLAFLLVGMSGLIEHILPGCLSVVVYLCAVL